MSTCNNVNFVKIVSVMIKTCEEYEHIKKVLICIYGKDLLFDNNTIETFYRLDTLLFGLVTMNDIEMKSIIIFDYWKLFFDDKMIIYLDNIGYRSIFLHKLIDYYTNKLIVEKQHEVLSNNFIFVQGKDQHGNDLYYKHGSNISEAASIAMFDPLCVGFNTLGFFKHHINMDQLLPSNYFGSNDGVYVKTSFINRHSSNSFDNSPIIRLKMLCNWCSSPQLCKEWSNMCEEGYRWKNLEMTSDEKSNENDYFIIINKPPPNVLYNPKKTIVFQMEPWGNNETMNWGVKTWGQWANPDPNKFLAVRGRRTEHHNNAFWQLELTLDQIINLNSQKEKVKENYISSICSSKYYDEGHIKRIDFLKYLENKNDIGLDIYNSDNVHNFKSYRGPLSPYIDKSHGIVPYKYYFMMENNFERNFITEKIWEPILCETLVFYYGCPNVTDHIDSLAFVELDPYDFEKSYQIIKKAISEDLWSQRIEIIRKEKKRILDELAFFPVVHKIINDHQNKINNEDQN